MKKRALAKTVSVVFQFMVTAAAGFVITFGTFIYLLTGISLWVPDYFGLPEADGVPAYILVLAFIVAVCLAACIVMAPYFMIPEDFSSVSGGEMLQGEIRSGDRAAQEGKNADRLHDVARLQADYKKLFKKMTLWNLMVQSGMRVTALMAGKSGSAGNLSARRMKGEGKFIQTA